jgi:acyl-CoA thioesterase FadM
MSETDETGFLYFTNLQKFAIEAFEELMEISNSNIFSYLESLKLSLPIVSAKAEYKIPLKRGDEIKIKFNFIKLNTTSIEVKSSVFKGEHLAGEVLIHHVLVSKETKSKMEIPESLRKLFSEDVVCRI